MSEVKVNKISPRSGTDVTLGDSGDTFTIPSGATINNQGTATNFGATGSASWNTTVKTGDFTAVAGEGYFVNTTSGAINVTLPSSPSAGAVVAIKDYANTFDTNAVTLLRNGSNIGGNADNSLVSTEGIAVTLVYVDGTKGWLVTDDGLQSSAPGPEYIVATGGTITTVCTNFRVHTFTGPGTFTVCRVGNAEGGSNTIDYMVIAGGGGGGGNGGGGGAGGFRESKTASVSGCWTASPLVSSTPLTVAVQGYPVTVGAGGSGPPGSGASTTRNGNDSVFSTITSTGGGGGGTFDAPPQAPLYTGASGGSGGGGAAPAPPPGPGPGGSGNTPSVTPAQGKDGGGGYHQGCVYFAGGGGGGATAVGATGGNSGSSAPAGNGGAGATNTITGSPVGRAGGGNGKGCGGAAPSSGQCGGAQENTAGTANTGGGGGSGPSGSGGSGIVVIRYKFQ